MLKKFQDFFQDIAFSSVPTFGGATRYYIDICKLIHVIHGLKLNTSLNQYLKLDYLFLFYEKLSIVYGKYNTILKILLK